MFPALKKTLLICALVLAIIFAIVVGGIIVSKLTCQHINEYEIEILPYKRATCQEEGLTPGKKCNYCGKIFVEQEVIPKTDKCVHIETLPSVLATCYSTGLTQGSKCSDCGKIIVEQEVTSQRSCTDRELIYGYDATCTQTGLTNGQKCRVCGKILVKQQTIPMLACNPSNWIVDKQPTKMVDGSRHTECTVCHKTIRTEILYAGSQGLKYKENDDGTYSVVGIGECTDTEIVIPRMYRGQNVSSIADNAFKYNKKITSVKITDNIKSIGDMAFYQCEKLKNVMVEA
jgi:hypothetical protein